MFKSWCKEAMHKRRCSLGSGAIFWILDTSKNTSLKAMCFKIRGLLQIFEAWIIRHIERALNEEAHKAA